MFEGIRSVSKKLANLVGLMYLLRTARKLILPESQSAHFQGRKYVKFQQS